MKEKQLALSNIADSTHNSHTAGPNNGLAKSDQPKWQYHHCIHSPTQSHWPLQGKYQNHKERNTSWDLQNGFIIVPAHGIIM